MKCLLIEYKAKAMHMCNAMVFFVFLGDVTPGHRTTPHLQCPINPDNSIATGNEH